jgi:hypothetical protein
VIVVGDEQRRRHLINLIDQRHFDIDPSQVQTARQRQNMITAERRTPPRKVYVDDLEHVMNSLGFYGRLDGFTVDAPEQFILCNPSCSSEPDLGVGSPWAA